MFVIEPPFTGPAPSQGDVTDPIAPQRDAVSTEMCKRLSTHTIQPNCMIPMMNPMTGRATKANSTAVAPRLFLKKLILLNPECNSGRIILRRRPCIHGIWQKRPIGIIGRDADAFANSVSAHPNGGRAH